MIHCEILNILGLLQISYVLEILKIDKKCIAKVKQIA